MSASRARAAAKVAPEDLMLAGDESIGAAVRETYLAFKSTLHDKLRSHQITSAQWLFLRVLWVEDGLGQKELAQRVRVHPTTTVAAVDVLEKHGYLQRRRSEIDRRQINVFLTDKGHALASELLPFAAEVNRRASKGITQKDMQVLMQLLSRLRANLGR